MFERYRALAIVNLDLFQQAQQQLAEQRQTYLKNGGRPNHRNRVNPTQLVRPVCGYCGSDLWLARGGKYASSCCLNGRDRKAGCQLTENRVREIDRQLAATGWTG